MARKVEEEKPTTKDSPLKGRLNTQRTRSKDFDVELKRDKQRIRKLKFNPDCFLPRDRQTIFGRPLPD
jgi:hypothetical protein